MFTVDNFVLSVKPNKTKCLQENENSLAPKSRERKKEENSGISWAAAAAMLDYSCENFGQNFFPSQLFWPDQAR